MLMSGRPETAIHHDNQKEPFVIVSGFNLCDVAAIRNRFAKCGVIVNDRIIGGDMWLQYSRSDETMRAVSCNNKPVISGSWVSVVVSPYTPPVQESSLNKSAPAPDAKHQQTDFTFSSEALSLPATSLCSLITPIPSKKEAISYNPSQRPSLSVRWSLLNKLPKQPRLDQNGYPIPENSLEGQQVRYSIKLPDGV
eukprot:TRINITY_DN4791_c1_g1_i1.p1 TRINITY_DN4791_c1_g1~~TRINITY_DN4791_c1_g1_i1.p1  ORF type:complete len:213 (+),score=36.41 TRINITY_DN4791_c1_g1_i1:55-639(+)